jgi:hypothetical protein
MPSNPANMPAVTVTDETRVPMSLPDLKLTVPEIEGFKLHWFADRPGRIPRAMAAGYQFVEPEEVRIRNFGFAEDLLNSGSTDLGNRVSVHGGVDDQGKAERLYLMKIKQEWYDKDMALREEASDKIVASLRAGKIGAERDSNVNRRYVKDTENLFTKKVKPTNGKRE